MTYDLLIEDVVNASTHFLQPQPPIPQSARPDGPFPPVLRRFIKKVRQKFFTYITGLSQCVKNELELFKIAAMASPRDTCAYAAWAVGESTASRRAGKGENEQYLVRNAFLNWDKDASGKLDYIRISC